MAKVADRYLEVDPWKIVEEGFHADRSEVSESLFALANEHQGARAFFDEGYSGKSLIGVYLNGIYEQRFTEGSAYKGVSNRLAFMVNTVNWLSTRIVIDGEQLDLATARFFDFRRQLDFRTGELRREFTWETVTGKRLRLVFLRLLSMEHKEIACQQIRLTPLNFSGDLTLSLCLDFSPLHRTMGENFWNVPRQQPNAMLGVTTSIGHRLFAGMKHDLKPPLSPIARDKICGVTDLLTLEQGKERVVNKTVVLHTARDLSQSLDEAWQQGIAMLERCTATYDEIKTQNRAWWDNFWAHSDIVIEGDPENQQGIRFCLFQMQQTYRGAVDGANIGAKGLTGEAYNGNAFWDTETYCLPFYLFSNPAAAKSLLDFRDRTLPQAMARARDLDCQGACYPVATSDGTESCTLWQHASLQFQPTTAVAYALWHYARVTGDDTYLHREGKTMLVEICRFLASRGQWSPRGGFGYYAVMGPDEFQMMVNNNAYTNYMAKRTFEFALDLFGTMDAADLLCTPGELAEWQHMADAMIIPFDPATNLYEQHAGFFDLPHLDIDAIPVEDFPLYHHWSYDRIYRNDMIKQPDVLMFMFLYNRSFSRAAKQANYDYYEPRCIHESSLSPSVHSILAAELGRVEEAADFFRFATRIDLDNYNRNTHEGLHTTSIAAAWMNIVYGFGGMRSDGGLLSFNPTIPPGWQGYSFHLRYRGATLRVHVSTQCAHFTLTEGDPVRVLICDEEHEITAAGFEIAL